jgi:hypothetical protein
VTERDTWNTWASRIFVARSTADGCISFRFRFNYQILPDPIAAVYVSVSFSLKKNTNERNINKTWKYVNFVGFHNYTHRNRMI